MFKKVLLLLLFPSFCWAQITVDTSHSINKYLQHFRSNKAVLTAFFKAFPKGGDLHHHYSGSVPMEIFVDHAIQNYWVNPTTLTYTTNPPKKSKTKWYNFEELSNNGILDKVRNDMIQAWSVREFVPTKESTSEHFFDSFEKFGVVKDATYEEGLSALKKLAIEENMPYLETMFTSINCDLDIAKSNARNAELIKIGQEKNAVDLQPVLRTIYDEIKSGATKCSDNHNNWIADYHKKLELESNDFTMRYLNYVVRVKPPVSMFRDLIYSFLSVDRSPLVVGVNIVAPEHHFVAIRDYWLHMQMFAFLHNLYPNVKITTHAGELTPDVANPIELNYHIREAIEIAGAKRIGHGVDIAYENGSSKILNKMKEEGIAIEINLTSNEFILGVKNETHPITLYQLHGVPIVLSTDDAGILRTTISDQYTLLCQRYPIFSYEDIKEISYNSIRYSFIEEDKVKERLIGELDERFSEFEALIIDQMKKAASLKSLLILE